MYTSTPDCKHSLPEDKVVSNPHSEGFPVLYKDICMVCLKPLWNSGGSWYSTIYAGSIVCKDATLDGALVSHKPWLNQ